MHGVDPNLQDHALLRIDESRLRGVKAKEFAVKHVDVSDKRSVSAVLFGVWITAAVHSQRAGVGVYVPAVSRYHRHRVAA